MKLFLLSSLLSLSFVLKDGCKKQSATSSSTCIKGRLEIKALCMNYTIKVLEGDMDTSMIAASWQDESTGITHQNVFRLASVCNFPTDFKQGDSFYFTIDTTGGSKDCAVCMAYYPTPQKALSIVVRKTPCN